MKATLFTMLLTFAIGTIKTTAELNLDSPNTPGKTTEVWTSTFPLSVKSGMRTASSFTRTQALYSDLLII